MRQASMIVVAACTLVAPHALGITCDTTKEDEREIIDVNFKCGAWNGPRTKDPPLPSRLNCSLVVISAGIPRSGSTMQDTLLAMAIGLVRGPGRGPLKMFWNYHWHASHKLNNSSQVYTASSERLNHLPPGSVVLMKTHQYDERLVKLCNAYIAFTTHRHPVEMIKSASGAGWGTMRNWRPFLTYNLRQHACWHAVCAEDTSHAELKEDTVEVLRRYVHKIHAAIHGPASRPNVSEGDIRRAATRARGNPSTRSNTQKPDPALKKIFCNYRSWMLKFGYTA